MQRFLTSLAGETYWIKIITMDTGPQDYEVTVKTGNARTGASKDAVGTRVLRDLDGKIAVEELRLAVIEIIEEYESNGYKITKAKQVLKELETIDFDV